MRRNFILIVILLLQVRIYAQQPRPELESVPVLKAGEVHGVILDSSTQGAIEYATVGLYRLADSSLVSGVVTDTRGFFVFRNIGEGRYYIDANFLGYNRKKVPLTVVAGSGINLGSVTLHPDITQIEEVTVVAQNQRMEYKIDKKVVNIAQDITSSGGTLVNALENTPSIEVDVEGNVTLRGSGNFQLLIDGKPGVIQGSEGLQQIPASAVQSVEIITSPSAKYDPDGDAGIINVIMKKQKNSGVGGVINVSVGTKHKYSGDFLLNMKRNKLNYFLGGEYSDQQFHNTGEGERRTYSIDTVTSILTNMNGEFARKSMSLKSGFDYSINDMSTLSLSGTYGGRDFNRDFHARNSWFTAPASKDSFFIEQDDGSDHNEFYNINLDFIKRYNAADHKLQASVYFSSESEVEKELENISKTNNLFEILDTEGGASRSRTEQPEKELRLELDYTRPVGKGKIETGLQSRWDQSEADYKYENFNTLGNEWLRNDTISNSIYYLDALQSVYFTVSGPVGKFEYQAGLRAEYDNRQFDQRTSSQSYNYENLHLFPSVFITRKFSDAHQLQLTYSRRIQRPNLRNLNPFKDYRGSNNVFFGNPSLKPEFTNAFELNYQYTFDKGFFSVETYYRATYDKITQINGLDTLAGRPVFTFTVANADRDHSLGIEMMTNLDINRWWQLNITGNIFRYQLNGRIDGEEVTSVSNSWRTNLNSTFKLKWDTRFQFTTIYNGPSNTLQGKREGFFVANAAVRKEFFKKQLSVSLNARDIFSTGKFEMLSEGDSFYAYNKFKRESPVVMLNLTYRINNYRQNGNRRDNGGAEAGGGMDEMM